MNLFQAEPEMKASFTSCVKDMKKDGKIRNGLRPGTMEKGQKINVHRIDNASKDRMSAGKRASNKSFSFSWYEGFTLTGRNRKKKTESKSEVSVKHATIENGAKPGRKVAGRQIREEIDEEHYAPPDAVSPVPCETPFAGPLITYNTIPNAEWTASQCRIWLICYVNHLGFNSPNWLTDQKVKFMIGNCWKVKSGARFIFLGDAERYWATSPTDDFLGRKIYERLLEIRCNDKGLVMAGVHLKEMRDLDVESEAGSEEDPFEDGYRSE